MTNLELFTALGGISSENLSGAEELQNKPCVRTNHKMQMKRAVLIAAVIALILLLVGCTVAYVLHLQDLKMGNYAHTQPRYIDADGNKIDETEIVREVISLQGVTGSPNFKATQEWFAFEQEYDKDHTLLYETDKHPIDVPSEYDAYFVYTQEMMDKVDEIAGKYALDLAGEMVNIQGHETDIFFDSLGIQQLHRHVTDIRYAGGYFYACGNFKMEFFVTPTGLPYEVLGSYRYNGKAYFDVMYSSVSSIENCEEEVYQLSDGQEVLIVMDEEYAHVLYDRKDAFISLFLNRVNWSADGTQEHLTKQDVEHIADCFDFSVTPQKPDVELAKQKLQASYEAYQKEQEAIMATYDNPFQHDYDSYDDVIQTIIGNGVDPETFQYALRDITGDGVDELFLGVDGMFGTIKTTMDGQITTLWSVGADTGSCLCEGNIVRYCGADGEYEHYCFMKFDQSTGTLTQFLSMGYDPWQESWYYSKSFVDFTYISKAEFDEMVNSYKVIDIGMRPISEYPFS